MNDLFIATDFSFLKSLPDKPNATSTTKFVSYWLHIVYSDNQMQANGNKELVLIQYY